MSTSDNIIASLFKNSGVNRELFTYKPKPTVGPKRCSFCKQNVEGSIKDHYEQHIAEEKALSGVYEL